MMVGTSKAEFGKNGGPLLTDIQMRDSIRECMERFQQGSPTRQFYAQIVEYYDKCVEFLEGTAKKPQTSL